MIRLIHPTKEEYPDMHTRRFPTFAEWFSGVWNEFQDSVEESKRNNEK
jgi:hypothetical protein